jgi:outer membrane protein assembly factor BamB
MTTPTVVSHSVSRRIATRLAALLTGLSLAALPAAVVAAGSEPRHGPATTLAAKVLKQLDSPRGLAVVVGDATGDLALALARQSELLVYLQLPDARTVAAVRRAVDAAGFYGQRVYVEHGAPTRLHLAENLADVLVATGSAASLPQAEALRVLRPQAKAFLGSREITKPFPAGIDEWTHPHHGPDNNPASRDQLARAPYLTQFLADPRYAPLPQVAVASAGRVFKLFGHIAFKEREEAWLNTLAAFNGYNGAFLWRREIPAGLMVHRNTLIATPTTVYFGDNKSCQVIDAATGALRDEIAPPEDVAGGTFWKWMALEGGVLYALIGEQEQRDPVIRMKSDKHGWPWDPLSPGYNQSEQPWGFGRTMLALDPATKKVLWRHQEKEDIDSRALCLAAGRVFLFRHGAFLACLDAKTGRECWRRTISNAPELFVAFGAALPRQDWRTNWRTVAYIRGSDRALYFAGPTLERLIAVSTEDGRLLWQHPYGNYQLVLQGDGLYALSGQADKELSRKFEPLTGRVLEEYQLGRRACSRPIGALDAVFCRANGGSTRLDLGSNTPQLLSPMRAQCHDGVTVAHGLLYWWPSVCDCNLTLYGITCLGPARDFNFTPSATDAERLERSEGADAPVADLPVTPADWPMFRANHSANVTTDVTLPARVHRLWMFNPPAEFVPTAPTTAGGFIFLGGSDGIVRALDATSGKLAWQAYTGSAIRYPPTIAQGRAYVGSSDGWVYAFEARTGRQLWRFRAAPMERRIPVYGQLLSTWPAASGVLVQDGVAYVAAGIVNYDGTYVYALDAATGRLKWQNNSSGHLDPAALAGVSVQGHLLLHDGRLYLAGGNVVSPGVYDARDGRCLNDVAEVHRTVGNNVPASLAPRGAELFRLGDQVRVAGKPFYAHPKWGVYDASVFNKVLLATPPGHEVAWVNNAKLLGFAGAEPDRAQAFLQNWGRPRTPNLQPTWEVDCSGSVALAVGRNALVVARNSDLVAFDLQGGRQRWMQMMFGVPVPWGLALDRRGCVIAALENGQVLCYGEPAMMAAR